MSRHPTTEEENLARLVIALEALVKSQEIIAHNTGVICDHLDSGIVVELKR